MSCLKAKFFVVIIFLIVAPVKSFEYSRHEQKIVETAAKNFNLMVASSTATVTMLAHAKTRGLHPALYLTTFTALSNAMISHKKISKSK